MISGALFVGFLVIKLGKQKKRSSRFFKNTYSGKVIATEKASKGYHDIYFLTETGKESISISYEDSSFRVYSVDSIYKQASSWDIFVKNYEDSGFIKLHVNVLP